MSKKCKDVRMTSREWATAKLIEDDGKRLLINGVVCGAAFAISTIAKPMVNNPVAKSLIKTTQTTSSSAAITNVAVYGLLKYCAKKEKGGKSNDDKKTC